MIPLITVIVPVYNVEAYIRTSIDSIVNQTYQNLEIILVDDGSTDKSGKICDECGEQDARVIVLHKENGGQGSARNRALDIAKGEYICFLDSDDSVKDDYVEFLYNQLIEHNLDISVCNYDLYDEEGTLLKARKKGTGYVEIDGIQAIKSMWTQGIINVGPWVKLYKKMLWEKTRFKECFSEDWATMHFVFEKAKKVGYSYESKLNYLIRKSSSIRSFQDKKLVMMNIAEDNMIFAEKYPELLPAARQKAASVYFHLLFQMPNNENYDIQRKEIEGRIKELRGKVLSDSKCIRKTKIALLLSYIGFDMTKKVFRLTKKADKTF